MRDTEGQDGTVEAGAEVASDDGPVCLPRIPPLTPSQQRAAAMLDRHGCVRAGGQVSTSGGWLKVPITTLEALERRGLGRLGLHPDGGMCLWPKLKSEVSR
jgi:hypothetical protein